MCKRVKMLSTWLRISMYSRRNEVICSHKTLKINFNKTEKFKKLKTYGSNLQLGSRAQLDTASRRPTQSKQRDHSLHHSDFLFIR